MPWITTPIVLALSLALAQGLEPRITYVEGMCLPVGRRRPHRRRTCRTRAPERNARSRGWRQHGALRPLGRAHPWSTADCCCAPATARRSDLEVPYARLRLAPSGVYNVLADAAHGRLLVSVIVGRVDLQGRYGQATRIDGGPDGDDDERDVDAVGHAVSTRRVGPLRAVVGFPAGSGGLAVRQCGVRRARRERRRAQHLSRQPHVQQLDERRQSVLARAGLSVDAGLAGRPIGPGHRATRPTTARTTPRTTTCLRLAPLRDSPHGPSAGRPEGHGPGGNAGAAAVGETESSRRARRVRRLRPPPPPPAPAPTAEVRPRAARAAASACLKGPVPDDRRRALRPSGRPGRPVRRGRPGRHAERRAVRLLRRPARGVARSTTTRRTPSPACWARTGRSSASSPSSGASSSTTTTSP